MTLPYNKKRQKHRTTRKKHRTQLEEEILHLRRTGRYIPPPRTSWMKSLVDVVEKRYIEPLANLFERADIFKIAEKLGIIIAVVSAIVGVLFYVLEARDRKERSILEAWQVVKDGKDEKSGVIVLALQRLHREGFRLAGINLKGTNLSYVTLIQANLRNTNFSGSDLSGSNLSGAILYQAILNGTNFNDVNLIGVNLQDAELSNAKFNNTQFGCMEKFRKLRCTNFLGAKNLTPEQVKQAKNWDKAIYSKEFRIKLGLPPEPMR